MDVSLACGFPFGTKYTLWQSHKYCQVNIMHQGKSLPDQTLSNKLIKAPKGSGFYLLEIPRNVGRKVPAPQGKPSVPLKWIRNAVKKVARERELLLTQYKLEHAKGK